jgi:hypothetical protein
MLPEPDTADAFGTPQRKQTSPLLGQKDEVRAEVLQVSMGQGNDHVREGVLLKVCGLFGGRLTQRRYGGKQHAIC